MIYLDTHVAVWLYEKTLDRFSNAVLAHLEAAPLLISPMVVLELQYLYETGRIREESEPILSYLRNTIDLEVCSLPFAEIASLALRQQWTTDPFDRIIAAHAMLRQMPLVTKDTAIREHYSKAMW